MARRLELEYVADTSGFTRGTKEVRSELGKVDQASDKSSGKIRSGMGRADAAVAGFAGGVAANLAGNALGAVVNFGRESITAASDMNETVSKSRAIFGEQAGAVEKWATAGAKNFGLAKSDALGYVASLGDMAAQIGFTGKQSAAFGQDLVQVSADLGSFNNLETDDVLDKITAAMRGEYDSLQAIIPNINAARVEQEALTLSGKKAAKELTAQDKALAVQAILHKDGARAMGDFAKTSGGFANQQKIAAAQVQTLQENLGTALLPILVTVMGFLTGTAIPALAEFAGWFTTNLGPAIADFAGSLSNVMPALQAFGGFLASNARVLLPLAAGVVAIVAAIRIWSAVQAVLNVVLAANPIGIVVLAIGALVAGLIYAYQNSETFRNVVDATFRAVWSVVETVVRAVVTAVRSVADWLTRTWKSAVDFGVRVIRAFQEVKSRIVAIVRGMVSAVTGFFWDMVTNGARFVLNLRDNFVRGVTSLRDRAVSLILNLRDRFFSGLRSLRDGAANITNQIRDWITSRIRSLVTSGAALVLNLRDRFFSGLRSLRDGAATIIGQMRDFVMARVNSLRDRIYGFVTAIRTNVPANIRRLRDSVVKIFSGMRDTVGRVFSGLLDKIKSPLRTVFSWINRNLIGPLNSVTSKFGLTIPDLPKFHKGGEVSGRGERPIMALGGEGVLNRRAMRRIGGRRGLDMMNAGGPGDWWENFTEFISTPAKLIAQMAEQGVKWAVGQVLGAIPSIPGTGVPIADVVPGIFNALKSRALSWAGDQEAKQQAELGTAGGSIGSGPWVKPVGAGIGNGYLGYPGHYGVDMPVGTGTRVHAVSNAIVSKAASLTYSYGKHLMLRHADGLVTVYAHLSQLMAQAGQQVRTGQVIGLSGSTGNSSGPHLHFETRVGGGYPGPNPRTVMAARGVTLDSGGMLQPGLTLVRNATGGPEPVLTQSQFAAMRGAATGGGNINVTIQGALDPDAVARQVITLLDRYDRRRGGVKVNRGTR